MTWRFQLVDVFGNGAFTGNPLAVIAQADALDAAEMLRVTRWLNLSETTFLVPPSDERADYAVRIFTLERELPFAGHPTLGTCHAWLRAGGMPREAGMVVQECGAGLVRVRRDGARLAFAAPPLIRSGPVDADTLAEVAAVLGIAPGDVVDAQWVDNGPGWVGVLLPSADAVRALTPARAHDRRIDIGVVGPHAPGSPHAYEVRAFFSDAQGGLIEDPVTGSLNASIAQWMLASGRAAAPYTAAQGGAIGRDGVIAVKADADGTLWIGGETRTLFEGAAP